MAGRLAALNKSVTIVGRPDGIIIANSSAMYLIGDMKENYFRISF